jgi:hypothetical protein
VIYVLDTSALVKRYLEQVGLVLAVVNAPGDEVSLKKADNHWPRSPAARSAPTS